MSIPVIGRAINADKLCKEPGTYCLIMEMVAGIIGVAIVARHHGPERIHPFTLHDNLSLDLALHP